MKKYNWFVVVITVLLAILCVVFWQQKDVEHKKMENFCQISATIALENFTNYAASGKESDYISGVAEFRSFMSAYLFLNDNITTTEYTWCNIVYGDMVLNPEKVQSNIQELIDALEYLSENYNHPNGFNLLHIYSNKLTHGND